MKPFIKCGFVVLKLLTILVTGFMNVLRCIHCDESKSQWIEFSHHLGY